MKGLWRNELSATTIALSHTEGNKARLRETLMDYDPWKLICWQRTTQIKRSGEERMKNYASTVGSQGTSYEIVNRNRPMVKERKTSIRKASDSSRTPKQSE